LKRASVLMRLAATALCFVLGSCSAGLKEKTLETKETAISEQAVGSNFSLDVQDSHLYMIYPSLDALSLNLVSADISAGSLQPTLEETKYLDRISYSPDIGEDFGKHLFAVSDPFYHILYVDRESEEDSVLKWLSKTGEDESWWIDAYPGLPDPLAGVPEQQGNLEVVLSEGGSLTLYRLHTTSQPAALATASPSSGALVPKGENWVVRQGDEWAFSVYDDRSQRLYLVHPSRDTLKIEPVYASGQVHYTTLMDDRLCILVFDAAESTITMLERASIWPQAADQRAFEVLPVTLCEGTTSVFTTSYRGEHLFLFNERITEAKEPVNYQLSLLYPESAGGKYEKTSLATGQAPIQGFRALLAGDTLYVLYLKTDRLALLTVSLQTLGRSP
jgi:hypothetical protein